MAPPALYRPRQTLARRLVTWLARRLQIVEAPTTVITSQEWAQDVPVAPAYPAVNSTSAMGSFPWVVAAVNAISTDIAGLPLIAQRGRGDSRRRVPGHAGLVALMRPASEMPPTLWRRQMIQDLLLTGNSYTLMLTAPGSGRLAALVRLEPELVEVLPGEGKTVRGYAYGEATTTIYDAADVVHIRQTSWRSGVESIIGQGGIEPLRTELAGEHAASQRWQEEAGRGRAGMIVSPKEDGPGAAGLMPDVAPKVLQRIQAQLYKHGAAAIGAGIDVNLLPFSARDMEFIQAREWTRDAVLAVFGVAGTRVGLPNANYATARESSRVYWQNLKGLLALIEDGYAQIAERAGRPGDRIVHDLSDVEVLQESRSDRLERAKMLVEVFGMTPADALAYEGFDDVTPEMFSQPAGQAEAAPAPGPEDTSTEQRNVLQFLQRQHARAVDLTPTAGMVEEAERAVRWIEEGLNGDGMTDAVKQWARRVASGEALSEDKVRKMPPWFARHEVDRDGEGFNPGEPGYPSPGRVAWAAWFGDAGRAWAERKVAQLDADTEREAPQMIAKNAASGGAALTRDQKTTVVLKMVGDPEQVEVGQPPRFRFIASTAEEDRHGDVVRQNWRLESFKQNPVILWNHDSSRAPIARAYDVAVIDGHLEIGMEFDVEDDFAMQVAGKIRRGFINAGSVGFISHAMGWREDLDKADPNYAEGYGMVLDDNELMEFSITPVQSNRGALVAQRRAAFEQRSRPAQQGADDLPAFLREATTTQPGDRPAFLED